MMRKLMHCLKRHCMCGSSLSPTCLDRRNRQTATTFGGLIGILTLGRVLRSSLEAVGSSQSDKVLSFYGKASQEAHYEPSKLEFVSQLHRSTKNSAGVVVGTEANPPARSMRAICASFMLWCTHLIDRIWVLSRHPQCTVYSKQ